MFSIAVSVSVARQATLVEPQRLQRPQLLNNVQTVQKCPDECLLFLSSSDIVHNSVVFNLLEKLIFKHKNISFFHFGNKTGVWKKQMSSTIEQDYQFVVGCHKSQGWAHYILESSWRGKPHVFMTCPYFFYYFFLTITVPSFWSELCQNFKDKINIQLLQTEGTSTTTWVMSN